MGWLTGWFGNKQQQEEEEHSHHAEQQHPLLSGGSEHKPSTTFEAHEEVVHRAASSKNVARSTFFNDGPRERKDVAWAIAYASLCAAVVVFGCVLFATGARDFWSLVSPDHLQDPESCPLHQAPLPHARRGLFGLGASSHDDEGDATHVTFTELLAHPVSAVMGTLGGSLGVGALFVLGIRYRPLAMIIGALVLQVSLVAGLGVWLMVAQQTVAGGFLFAYAALLVGLFYMWRQQIQLVGRLLGLTGSALADNPSLVLLGLSTPVVWALMLLAALALSLGALTNGHVAVNPQRGGRPATHAPDGHLQCLGGEDGTQEVLCCTWQVEPQAWVYMSLLGVALTWSSLLLGQIKLFATAGAVAQWYFIPADATLSAEAAPTKPSASFSAAAPPKRRRVLRSLRHALGPQFGTLCAASALLTVISYLRQALDAAEQNAQNENRLVAFVCLIFASLLRVLLSLVEFLTRFTTVRAAVTGEGFMDAAHNAVDLLRRNAMDAFGVWWLPPFILGNCALLLSVLLGTVTWATADSLVYRQHEHSKHPTKERDASSVAVGVLAFLTAWAVLQFLSGLLQDVLDSVFLCFAVDRDQARVTRADVHVVMQELPSVHGGAVVQQPGGEVAYGASAGHV